MFGSVSHRASFAKNLTITIAANTQNFNMKTAALAAGWNGRTPLKLTVVVNPGVVIGSASTGSFAFDTGVSLPAGSTLALINNGTIASKGGAAAASGGPALRAQVALAVTNNGVIGGGGGGGGKGGDCHGVHAETGSSSWVYGGSGGDGQGASGGPLLGPYGGASGGVLDGEYYYIAAGAGATGGVLGSAGASGATSSGYTKVGWGSPAVYTYGGSVGAVAGACTSGNSNITWIATGTRYGALN